MQQNRADDMERNRPSQHSWGSGDGGTRNSGRESPFSIRNEFADVDLEGGSVEVTVERRGGGGVRGRGTGREQVVDEGEERPSTSSSVWTCCLNCRGVYPAQQNLKGRVGH